MLAFSCRPVRMFCMEKWAGIWYVWSASNLLMWLHYPSSSVPAGLKNPEQASKRKENWMLSDVVVRKLQRRHCMERRSSRRTLIDETAIFTKDGIFTALLENISMGGLFLRTNKPIAVGEIIEITIPLPLPSSEGQKTKIVVDAVAVRVEEHGVAFKFLEMNDNTYNALLFLTDPQPTTLTN